MPSGHEDNGNDGIMAISPLALLWDDVAVNARG